MGTAALLFLSDKMKSVSPDGQITVLVTIPSILVDNTGTVEIMKNETGERYEVDRFYTGQAFDVYLTTGNILWDSTGQTFFCIYEASEPRKSVLRVYKRQAEQPFAQKVSLRPWIKNYFQHRLRIEGDRSRDDLLKALNAYDSTSKRPWVQ